MEILPVRVAPSVSVSLEAGALQAGSELAQALAKARSRAEGAARTGEEVISVDQSEDTPLVFEVVDDD